jgi:hypothetical protein
LANRQNKVFEPTTIITIGAEEMPPFIKRLREFTDDLAAQILEEVPSGWLTNDLKQGLQKYLAARAKPTADALEARFKK